VLKNLAAPGNQQATAATIKITKFNRLNCHRGAETQIILVSVSLGFCGKKFMTPERKKRLLSVLQKRQNDLTVVLENVFDPHNISAVMRTCDAVGVQEVYVLNTKIPKHKKWGAKSSSSAAKWLTVHQFTDAENCFSSLRKRYSTILTTCLTDHAISLHQVDFTKSTAIIFGNEHDGVSEEIRKFSDGNLIIPQVGHHPVS
jgi:tRNA (guanosine-2'-O-)-methyltransferase